MGYSDDDYQDVGHLGHQFDFMIGPLKISNSNLEFAF